MTDVTRLLPPRRLTVAEDMVLDLFDRLPPSSRRDFDALLLMEFCAVCGDSVPETPAPSVQLAELIRAFRRGDYRQPEAPAPLLSPGRENVVSLFPAARPKEPGGAA